MRVSNLKSVVSLCAAAVADRPPAAAVPPAPAATGGAPALITLDGSSTVFPISEAVAEEFQKSAARHARHGRHLGHRRRLQEVLRGETDITDASRPISATEVEACKAQRHRVHRAAGRVRRPRDRREPEERRGSSDITVAELKTLWEPEAQGKVTNWSQVRTGLARPRDPPVRRRRRLGHLRLLHRGDHRQGTRRAAATSRRARTTTCSSRASASDELALGFFGFAYYEENKEKLKLVPVDDGKADNGDGPDRCRRRDGARTAPISRCRARSSSTSRRRPPSGPRCRSSSSSTSSKAATLVREVGYVGLGDAGLQAGRRALREAHDRHRCSAATARRSA